MHRDCVVYDKMFDDAFYSDECPLELEFLIEPLSNP